MGRGTPRHYKLKRNNRAYWEPTATMKRAGFANVSLGPHGPEAFKLAEQWNLRWDRVRTGVEPAMRQNFDGMSPDQIEDLIHYPANSLGAAFQKYRKTTVWSSKALRTREEWFRSWKWIKKSFGDGDPKSVGLEDISELRDIVQVKVSPREAHRVIKTWRALWKVAAAMGYCVRDADPSLAVRNTAAKGRSQTWTEGEAVRLVKGAWRAGYYGLAAIIAVAWDTQMSPGDIRSLTASQIATSGRGQLFFTERGKTGVPVGGMLSARSIAVIAAYLEKVGVEMIGEARIFRHRSGAPYTSDKLGQDFRVVRQIVFGADEARMLGHDFRRSGAVEAIVGEAAPAAVAHAMGNTLSASNVLFATYVPVNSETIRQVAVARRKGRNRLR